MAGEPTKDDVLAQYGRTMLRVQRFESSLIGLVFHYLPTAPEGSPSAPRDE